MVLPGVKLASLIVVPHYFCAVIGSARETAGDRNRRTTLVQSAAPDAKEVESGSQLFQVSMGEAEEIDLR